MGCLVISDDIAEAEKIAKKVVLLRKTDTVKVSDSYDGKAEIVLLHEPKSIDIIKEINATVFILTNNPEREFILEAYDAGMVDFCRSDAPDYEISIKVINAIRLHDARAKIKRYEDAAPDGAVAFDEIDMNELRSTDEVFYDGERYFVKFSGDARAAVERHGFEELELPPHRPKLFMKVFENKVESVIEPVFYRMQKEYEKATQTISGEKCVFQYKTGRFEITGNGTKALIRVTYEGLDTPENYDEEIPLTRLTQTVLEHYITDFIVDIR